MTFFISPPSLGSANAGREDDNLAGARGAELIVTRSWRAGNSRVACGEGRFPAFIDEKDDQFEVTDVADVLFWIAYSTWAFSTMGHALARVIQPTGASPATMAKACCR